jgi:AraC-like DNA-binding protein
MIRPAKIQRSFFVTYVSFFLCLILILLPLYFITIKSLEEYVLRSNRQVLINGISSLENEMKLIITAANNLYLDQDIVSLSYVSEAMNILPINTAQWRKAQNRFYNITSLFKDVSNSGIIFKNGSVLESSRTHMSYGEYYGVYMKESDSDSMEDWLLSLRREKTSYSLTPCVIETDGNTRKAVVFAVSLPLNTLWNRDIFFSVFNEQDILSLLALPDIIQHSSIRVLDESGNMLIDYGAPMPDDNIMIEHTGHMYGLKAYLRIDKALFMNELNSYRNTVLAGFILYLLFGIIMSVVYSRHNTKPLEKIVRIARSIDDSQESGGKRLYSSYENMYALIEEIVAGLKRSKAQLANQKVLIKENLLERMLRGEYYDSSVPGAVRDYFPDFPQPCIMLVIRLTGFDDLPPKDHANVRVALKDICEQNILEGSITHFTANLLVIMHPYITEEKAQEMVARIQLMILRETDIDNQIAVSLAFDDIYQAGKTFKKLLQLLRVRTSVENACVFETFNAKDSACRLVDTQAARFSFMISSGQYQKAEKLIMEDLDDLRCSGAMDEADIQQLFYCYRHSLIGLISDELYRTEKIRLPEYSRNNTLAETFHELLDCARRIADISFEQMQKKDNSFYRSVISYIDSHIHDPDLCVNSVTEHFIISKTTLQRILNEQTGKSFLEYVNAQRMEKARDLLINTRLSVKDISRQCGYASINTFYKAFKRTYDVTPIMMRNR